MTSKKLPNRLYKYRAFSNSSLDHLIMDEFWFADPSKFNDPLDSKPTLEIDIGEERLEKILRQLVAQRIVAKMTAAAQAIKYRGPKTVAHIHRKSEEEADRAVADVDYNATDDEHEVVNPRLYLLADAVERELLRRYGSGIVSLAERADCPLMWSHYGDQHNGLAIGYSMPVASISRLHKVKYGGKRIVEASKVANMLEGSQRARRAVDAAVYLKKARDWRYEQEWRLLGDRGLSGSPLEMEEVVFGLRCSSAVRYAVIKALEDRSKSVKFFEIRQKPGTFELKVYPLETGEMRVVLPRRNLDIAEAFAEIRLEL